MQRIVCRRLGDCSHAKMCADEEMTFVGSDEFRHHPRSAHGVVDRVS